MTSSSSAHVLVSVVIITRNRASFLSRCLRSLCYQHTKPGEVIIIDNGSTDNTKSISEEFVHSRLKVKYIYEPKIGYPFARNRGLRAVDFRYLAFIDDDCIASPHWLCEHIKSLKNKPTAVLGGTETVDADNPYAVATRIIESYWKSTRIQNNKIIDLEILDTKNLLLDNYFIQEHALRFDEARSSLYAGASEDCDFGMQLAKKNAKAIYAPKALVYHSDPNNLIHFMQKIFQSIRGHVLYEKKWSHRRKPLQLKHSFRFRNFFKEYLLLKNYPLLFSVQLFILVSVNIVINKSIRRVYS